MELSTSSPMDATLYDGDKQLEHQPIPEDMVDKANEVS